MEKNIFKSGQSAIEFFILVGAMLFVFLIFMALLNLNLEDRSYQKKEVAVNEIAEILSDEINLAYFANEGYMRSFSFPYTVIENKYSLFVEDGLIVISTSDGKHSAAFPTYEITGQPNVNGTNVIKKTNGTVILN